MKAIVRTLAPALCAGAVVALSVMPGWTQTRAPGTVDAYSSASETKHFLSGDEFGAASQALQAGSSDLASLATTKQAGYRAPKSLIANVMSTNPDGSVGISTITQWAYTAKGGNDELMLQLTYGQNAKNLAEVGNRGTLFVPGVNVNGKSNKYFIHFKVTKVDVLKYSGADFDAGRFNSFYSGKAGKKSQYTLSCAVLSIEEVSDSVKLSIVFP